MRNPKETQFLNALGSLFTGARVDGNGKSGYINLMHIKQQHFESVRGELMKRIDKIAPLNYPFREELFDKLHSFFHRYFCESGSIYFRHLPAWHRIYERVFADGQDVTLAWKTRNLYYVKSDYLIQSMPVELPESGTPKRFYFDASAMQGRQNNEPREFVFSFSDKQDQEDVTCLKVSFSKNGQKTNIDEILKLAGEHQMWLIDEGDIKNAIRIFRRQTEVDFFINKDAGGFLHEQFNLWLYQYMFSE
ncbi:MAG: site-specific DNA-methyltransferase, partial [Gammaproteobacteria bacterium]